MGKVAESGADAVLTTSHGGLINAVGLTNPGIDSFKDEMELLRKKKIPVVLSIFGDTVEEITEVAYKGIQLKPAAVELNLSCPHAEIGQIAHSPDLTHKYVSAVKDAVDCQVFAKLTPNVSDIISVGKAAEGAGADAIVAINTLRGMKIDIQQMLPVLGHKVGGLSGPPIFPVAVRCVFDLSKALTIPIIGVGGVSTWEDAVEMHLAGASAIQIGTALIEGLGVFLRIKEGVKNYLKEMKIKNLSEIVGAAWRSTI
jgi:dihydroorotate dehydrogenase (NAD+) catalytic subunit